jgi:hypothetical protein
MRSEICEHLMAVHSIKLSQAYICSECAKIGSDWVHLRTCQTCGVTLCCDDSPNRHMTRHFHDSGHPVVISAEPGERWMWCYADKIMAEY